MFIAVHTLDFTYDVYDAYVSEATLALAETWIQQLVAIPSLADCNIDTGDELSYFVNNSSAQKHSPIIVNETTGYVSVSIRNAILQSLSQNNSE